jgi:hypothetical protein
VKKGLFNIERHEFRSKSAFLKSKEKTFRPEIFQFYSRWVGGLLDITGRRQAFSFVLSLCMPLNSS